MVKAPSNIWVAAGDGDLARVKVSISPNAPDLHTYTPMHAAASYGRHEVLEYLISKGGDVNATDEDGDTPLYTVEDVATAQLLVRHGATIDRTNAEGVSPIEHLEEDFAPVADYLRSVAAEKAGAETLVTLATRTHYMDTAHEAPSQHTQNVASEQLTSEFIAAVESLAQRAREEGREPDEEEIQQLVRRTVVDGVLAGYQMTGVQNNGADEAVGVKRLRTDDAENQN
ncbi:ankyrin [Fistulina hepatica ATCC 64428]|nr:ankyrin [Fistulina hepatica ATCC 64428]